ncbi:putative quinol monooxygenase [Nocardia neocaledoniensis]|uniref:putative quinol monooxygenase n=1 Tax=Nocardia neocaledoniensis TaxID=236511 RepID=UPI002455FAFD|nr:putative quinol monooxygenase [Nocardia neocaledoniensis]
MPRSSRDRYLRPDGLRAPQARTPRRTPRTAALVRRTHPRRGGCLEYHVHVDSADPSVFAFYEVWRSRADLDEHLALPHMREFWESRMDYLSRDLDIRFIDMLSPYPR